jgi:CMP-N,N'-diacetyllegionaminic acid synthase
MIKDFKVLAIVPARGGSKRIPDKNIKELVGKPLIAHTIDEAKKSKYIDRILVSTDSEKIRDVSMSLGAEVPFLRPEEISGDKSTDLEAFTHALNWLAENEDYRPEIIVQLRPTSPLRTVEEIDVAVEMLVNNPDADSVRTVTRPEQHPYKMFKKDELGYLEPLFRLEGNPEAFNMQEQSLPECFKHIGYIDCMWRKTIIDKKKMSGDNILPYYIANGVSGINQPEDWEYYEILIKKRND